MTADIIRFEHYTHRLKQPWRRAQDASVTIMPGRLFGKYEGQHLYWIEERVCAM